MNWDLQLFSICRRKGPSYRKGCAHKIFPYLLNENFTASQVNQIWCKDFNYISLTNGTIRYNCSITDLYNRSFVTSKNGKWITTDTAIRTLDKALKSQRKKPDNLILHSDQGSQFTSAQFILYCQEQGTIQSMSAADYPFANAPMEWYCNTFKEALINRFHFQPEEELNQAISEYSYGW